MYSHVGLLRSLVFLSLNRIGWQRIRSSDTRWLKTQLLKTFRNLKLMNWTPPRWLTSTWQILGAQFTTRLFMTAIGFSTALPVWAIERNSGLKCTWMAFKSRSVWRQISISPKNLNCKVCPRKKATMSKYGGWLRFQHQIATIAIFSLRIQMSSSCRRRCVKWLTR